MLFPLYLSLLGFPTRDWPWAVLVYTLVVGALMVSRIPTFSMKRVGSIDREAVLFLFLALVAFIGLLVSFPWTVLTICSFLYLALIPVAGVQFRRAQRAAAG